MSSDPAEWRNVSPGDLSRTFPVFRNGDVESTVVRSKKAHADWAALGLEERWNLLLACRDRLSKASEDFAVLIADETGKPLREARLEMAAVVAKFDFVHADALRYASDEVVSNGPHPACVRKRSRGPAAVIGPFNFPVHLGHGAALAYLLGGNPVIYKPSPRAVNVGAAYAAEMQSVLPEGVFEFLPGGGETGRDLCLHPAVRSVCFTGSIPVGTALAQELAADYSKSLALELGGKNSLIVWEDADLAAAAEAAADGMCLTAGQRCNATSRILVHRAIAREFVEAFTGSLARFEPANPLEESTLLGPVISGDTVRRYLELTALPIGRWILPGTSPSEIRGGLRGHYVRPAVVLAEDAIRLDASPLATRETFAPVAVMEEIADEAQAVERHEAWAFGLTASLFTRDLAVFERIGNQLNVGNLYQNLPTTFSPSSLPFGGWGASGNGKPGGQGFIRYAVEDQAVQWKA